MAFTLRQLLDNPKGGQTLSSVVALTLSIVAALFFLATTVIRFRAGNGNWWLGIGPTLFGLANGLRLIKHLRSRHAN